MTENRKDCLNCSNAIFDPLWGEYKCKVTQHRMYRPDDPGCKIWAKGEPTGSNQHPEYRPEDEA